MKTRFFSADVAAQLEGYLEEERFFKAALEVGSVPSALFSAFIRGPCQSAAGMYAMQSISTRRPSPGSAAAWIVVRAGL